MLRLGLGALAHANWHSNFDGYMNDMWPELSVLQAAHAAEILIKARIAQEHPLLIFEQLPRSTQVGDNLLELQHLFERAKTVQYSDLPERLWATTGVKLQKLEQYHSFGKLRNCIQHFAPPSNIDFNRETVNFIYEVIDPFINSSWDLYAIDYHEDDESFTLVEGLICRGIKFLVSPDHTDIFENIRLRWPDNNPKYKKEMKKRIEICTNTHPITP